MKNKANLAVMEQVIMLLVLAVAAAICIQVFIQAHLTEKQNHLQDMAIQNVQNVAEIIKSTGNLEHTAQKTGGCIENGVLTVQFDGFTVTASPVQSDDPLLGRAKVAAFDEDSIIAQLDICWQEVGT